MYVEQRKACARSVWGAVLVGGQMALAMVLLAGAGVLVHSLLNIVDGPTGVRNPQNILVGSIGLPSDNSRKSGSAREGGLVLSFLFLILSKFAPRIPHLFQGLFCPATRHGVSIVVVEALQQGNTLF